MYSIRKSYNNNKSNEEPVLDCAVCPTCVACNKSCNEDPENPYCVPDCADPAQQDKCFSDCPAEPVETTPEEYRRRRMNRTNPRLIRLQCPLNNY